MRESQSSRLDDDEHISLQGSTYIPKRNQTIVDKENDSYEEEKEINLDNDKINSPDDNNNIRQNTKNEDSDFNSFSIIVNDEKEKDENNEKEKEKEKMKTKNKKTVGNILLTSLVLDKTRNKVLQLKIDKEKSKKEGHTIYEIALIKEKEKDELEKNILCYRRYNNFNDFYNALKIRYPHFIFPKLSPKESAKTMGTNMISTSNSEAFLEQRRKELQYFINEIYYHKTIGQGEEVKKFINDATFDYKYFNSLANFFDYPESIKKINNSGIINQGMEHITNFISYYTGKKSTDKNERKNETKILGKKEKIEKNIEKYKMALNEIRTIYECFKEEKNEKKNISTNLSFLQIENNNNNNNNSDDNIIKMKFNELIKINKEINQKSYDAQYDEYFLFFENEIVYSLDYCLLDLKGEKKAIERYDLFLQNYKKIINYKKQDKDNKVILEEQTKIKKDIDIYENTLIKEMERVEEKYSKIYQDIIRKLFIFLNNTVGLSIEKFKNSKVVE